MTTMILGYVCPWISLGSDEMRSNNKTYSHISESVFEIRNLHHCRAILQQSYP